MRICLYTETALPTIGGQEMVVDALARQFMELGHEPYVLAPPPRRLRTADHEFPYPVVRHPRFVSTRHFMEWYKLSLERAHRAHRFDAIHCHSVYPCGYLAALCEGRLGVPVVITSHGGDVYAKGRRLMKPGLPARYARSIGAADALISISRMTHDGFLRLCPTARNIVSIPNGVHVGLYARQAPRPETLDARVVAGQYVLFIGRLHSRKGVDVLIEAMSQIYQSLDTNLVIAGDGEERAALEALCGKLKIADKVHFLGAVRGAAKTWLLQNSRFAVIPSRTWEAFPLVVLESYAAGRPVIGTAIAGLADLIDERRTGLIVEPDSPVEMAAALTTLLADASLAEACGAHAKRLAQDYDWATVARRHIDLYDSLRAARPLRRAA